MRLKYSQGLLKDDNVIAGSDEKGVFAALDLPCPTPAEREMVEGNPVWLQREQQQYDKIWEEIKGKTSQW